MRPATEKRSLWNPEFQRGPGTPISHRLRMAAERLPAWLTRAADLTELVEHTLASAWHKRRRVADNACTAKVDVMVESTPAEHELCDEWDAIDEASWESFPASDPPSTWAGVDR